jgi:hypothetical protein
MNFKCKEEVKNKIDQVYLLKIGFSKKEEC